MNNNAETSPPREESEQPLSDLPTGPYARDTAVGARPHGHDHVLAPGCAWIQRRPSGWLEE